MKYKTILLDADETLFDFRAAERESLTKLMKAYGVECTDADLQAYAAFNAPLWSRFEKGELDKPEIFRSRFQFMLDRFGLSGDPMHMNQQYLTGIADCSKLFDGAESFVKKLSETHTLAIVTNGAEYAQKRRFAASLIRRYIPYLFVSEEIGAAKPDIRYFDAVFHAMDISDKRSVLIIGDSLSSDIQGGINAGIDTCWYNPQRKVNQSCLHPTMEIASYEELYAHLI